MTSFSFVRTSLSLPPCCCSFHILFSVSLHLFRHPVSHFALCSFICQVHLKHTSELTVRVYVHVCTLTQVLITALSARAPGSHCRSAHAHSAFSRSIFCHYSFKWLKYWCTLIGCCFCFLLLNPTASFSLFAFVLIMCIFSSFSLLASCSAEAYCYEYVDPEPVWIPLTTYLRFFHIQGFILKEEHSNSKCPKWEKSWVIENNYIHYCLLLKGNGRWY